MAGCGSAGAVGAQHHPRHKQAASLSGAAPLLRVSDHAVSIAAVRAAIAKLEQDHPAVRSYSVQDVSYDARSRARVLRACSTGGAQDTAQVESSRVLACAPMIFFYYSYGRSAGVKESTDVADSIYSYVATEIHGPSDARSILDGVLHAWGIPVAAQSGPSGHTTPGAKQLVAAVNRAMSSRHTVRVTITGYASGKPFERITSDTSQTQGVEVMRAGGRKAEIRVTHGVAYVRGNRSGLRRLVGLSARAARSARGGWLRAGSGSAIAKNLSIEDTLGSLAASVLPSSRDIVHMRSGHVGSTVVKVLSWTATAANGDGINAVLTVTAGADPLPISETTTALADRQVVRFSRWDVPISVRQPTHAIPLGTTAG